MKTVQIFYPELQQFVECEQVPVYDVRSRILGSVNVPVDKSILDIITDDPLTLWASEHGYSVDDLYAEY